MNYLSTESVSSNMISFEQLRVLNRQKRPGENIAYMGVLKLLTGTVRSMDWPCMTMLMRKLILVDHAWWYCTWLTDYVMKQTELRTFTLVEAPTQKIQYIRKTRHILNDHVMSVNFTGQQFTVDPFIDFLTLSVHLHIMGSLYCMSSSIHRTTRCLQ